MSFKWTNKILHETLSRTAAEERVFVQDTLDELGNRLVELIQQFAPKDTGEYAGSWRVSEVTENKVVVSSPDNLKFVIFEFTGARPHKIKGEPLAWEGGKFGPGMHFAFSVWHPGINKQPHVRPAMNQLIQTEANQIITRNAKKHLSIFSRSAIK